MKILTLIVLSASMFVLDAGGPYPGQCSTVNASTPAILTICS